MIHHNCPQCKNEHKFELNTQSKHVCTNCNKEMLSSFSKQNVFLTYSNDHNKQVVEKIKLDMEARGHVVFIDKEIASDTPTWKENLQSDLKEKSVISFLSEQAVSNPGDCLDQIAVALGAKGGHIQTILLEDETKVSPPPSVSHVQWLNMADWQDKLDTDSLWYGNKMLELLNVIESSENINFAGEIEKLNEYLRPITSSQRINQLISSPFLGRQWVFDAIEQWRTADDNKRIFWLSGLPGVGKSAVSAQLAHYCKDRVAAVHFCDYSNTEHRNASRVIRSISFQLCTRIPEFRRKVLFIPEVFDHSIEKMDSSELFECIIIKPLSQLIDSGRDRSLIVIDALDEATENKRNQLVDILAKYADRIPQWIRFVVTGRPEKELTGSLKDMEYDLLDISSKQNKADLEEYIRLKLPEQLAQCSNEQEAITNLIEKSEGIFLYIVQVCEEILQGHFSLTEPDKFPIGLDGLYYSFFLRLTGQVDKPEEEVDTKVYHEKYHTQLSMVMAAIEDLPTAIIKESYNWSAEQLNRFLLQIRTLFPIGTGADGETIHPFHKTIVDWIGNAERAKQFVVDLELGHHTIINNIEPKFENKESLSVYGQRNLPAHYLRVKKWDDILRLHKERWDWSKTWFINSDLEILLELDRYYLDKNKFWIIADVFLELSFAYANNQEAYLKVAESCNDLCVKIYDRCTTSSDQIRIMGNSYYIRGLANKKISLKIAEYFISSAVDIFHEDYSCNQNFISKCFDQIAKLNILRKNFDKAIIWYSKAIEIKKNLDKNSLELAISFIGCANIFKAADSMPGYGNLDSSIERITEAISILKRLHLKDSNYPSYRKYLADALIIYTRLLVKKGSRTKKDIIQILERALELLNFNNEKQACSLWNEPIRNKLNICEILLNTKQDFLLFDNIIHEIEILIDKTLQITKDENWLYYSVLTNRLLAKRLQLKGDNELAIQKFKTSIVIFEELYNYSPSKYSSVAYEVYESIINSYIKEKNYKIALEYINKCLSKQKKEYGFENAMCYCQLGYCKLKLLQFKESYTAYKKGVYYIYSLENYMSYVDMYNDSLIMAFYKHLLIYAIYNVLILNFTVAKQSLKNSFIIIKSDHEYFEDDLFNSPIWHIRNFNEFVHYASIRLVSLLDNIFFFKRFFNKEGNKKLFHLINHKLKIEEGIKESFILSIMSKGNVDTEYINIICNEINSNNYLHCDQLPNDIKGIYSNLNTRLTKLIPQGINFYYMKSEMEIVLSTLAVAENFLPFYVIKKIVKWDESLWSTFIAELENFIEFEFNEDGRCIKLKKTAKHFFNSNIGQELFKIDLCIGDKYIIDILTTKENNSVTICEYSHKYITLHYLKLDLFTEIKKLLIAGDSAHLVNITITEDFLEYIENVHIAVHEKQYTTRVIDLVKYLDLNAYICLGVRLKNNQDFVRIINKNMRNIYIGNKNKYYKYYVSILKNVLRINIYNSSEGINAISEILEIMKVHKIDTKDHYMEITSLMLRFLENVVNEYNVPLYYALKDKNEQRKLESIICKILNGFNTVPLRKVYLDDTSLSFILSGLVNIDYSLIRYKQRCISYINAFFHNILEGNTFNETNNEKEAEAIWYSFFAIHEQQFRKYKLNHPLSEILYSRKQITQEEYLNVYNLFKLVTSRSKEHVICHNEILSRVEKLKV